MNNVITKHVKNESIVYIMISETEVIKLYYTQDGMLKKFKQINITESIIHNKKFKNTKEMFETLVEYFYYEYSNDIGEDGEILCRL